MISIILNRRPRKYSAATGIKKRPLVFVDLEFSGLDLNQEVIEIGCLFVSQPDLKIKKEWSVKIKPVHIEQADKNALRIIGYSKKQWRGAVSLKEALVKFNKFAKGAVLIGYNVGWDFMFLEKSFHELKIKPLFHWQVLDVLSMAFNEFYNDKKIKGFRMREVVSVLNVSHGKWHNPLEDARATYKIFLKLFHGDK